MKITKKQLKKIIKEEKQKLQEMQGLHGSGDPLLDLEHMVASEVEELIMSIQEDHSLEGEGISMDELNMAIARGIDQAKAILRY